MMPGIDADPDAELGHLRAEIDRLDRRLVELLAERARVVQRVTEHKRRHRLPVVDRHREDAMLDRIAHLAKEAKLDPRVAQQVLRTVVDAFTLLQVEELGATDIPRSLASGPRGPVSRDPGDPHGSQDGGGERSTPGS
ncbi:MAG: chorismate mutase [Acidimicrobiales bacterium]